MPPHCSELFPPVHCGYLCAPADPFLCCVCVWVCVCARSFGFMTVWLSGSRAANRDTLRAVRAWEPIVNTCRALVDHVTHAEATHAVKYAFLLFSSCLSRVSVIIPFRLLTL